MNVYHLCSHIFCPLVPCAFSHYLINHQPNRIWFQTFYLDPTQSTGDTVSPSSQKLRLAVPIMRLGSHVPLLFSAACVQ